VDPPAPTPTPPPPDEKEPRPSPKPADRQNRSRDDRGGGGDGGQADAGDDLSARGGGAVLRNDADRIGIGGDQFFGKKIVNNYYHGERPIDSFQSMPAYLTDAVENAYVEPASGFDSVLDRLQDSSIVILSGPPGSGKTAFAIRLCQLAGFDEIYRFRPDDPLNQLDRAVRNRLDKVSDDSPGAAFLVIDHHEMGELTASWIHGLDRSLAAARSRLIVVKSEHVHLADQELERCVVPTPVPPMYRKVVESHVEWLIPAYPAEEILNQDGVAELIAEAAEADPSMAGAAHLAAFIRQGTRSGRVDLTAVRESLARKGEADFDIWFRGLSTDDRSFAVALAVFNRMPQAQVEFADKRLRERLSGVGWTSSSLGRSVPNNRTNAERLNDLRARIVEDRVRSDFGRLKTQIVEFADDTYPKQVLEWYWSQYTQTDALLNWLRELAIEKSVPMRMRAAMALGVLAINSFDRVHREVFEPWAGDKNDVAREAAANALRMPARVAELDQTVRRLVDEWHAASDRPQLQATAARFYGAVGTAERLPQILDLLGRLAVVAHGDVRGAVADSLAEIVAAGDDDAPTEQVLAALVDWLGNFRRAATGELAFLYVTWVMGVLDDDPERPEWPTLLVRADRNHRLRADLAGLWAYAICAWRYRVVVERSLTHWAALAERDGRLRQVFVGLIGAAANADTRTYQLLRRLVARWGDEDHLIPLYRTVALIRDHLGWFDDVLETEARTR
jgi:hypothetical protein